MTWTALHDACEHQDTKKVLSIAQVNEREAYSLDDHNSTPLHIACWSNPPLDVIRALLDAHPQGLKAKDVHGDTPLHIAVSNPMTRVDLVQTLVDACPDALSIANREGLMPLHAACRYSPKQDDTIALLVEAYAEAAKHRIKMGSLPPSSTRKDPLMDNPGNLHDPMVGSPSRVSHLDLRFEALGVQTRDGSYPLHMAIENGGTSLHVVDMLLNAAPTVAHLVNKFGETPLHVALRCCSLTDEALELLIQAEPSVLELPERRQGNLPLHLAVLQHESYSLSVVVQLMTRYEHAVHVANNEGKLPHDLVPRDGHQDLMDLLLVGEEADGFEDVDYDEAEVESEFSDTDPLW